MAKNLFKGWEVKNMAEVAQIETPLYQELEEEKVPEEEYTGPTAAELRAQAEVFRTQWNKEKRTMIDSANKEAESILKQAHDQAGNITSRAQSDATAMVEEAEEKVDEMLKRAQGELVKQEEQLNERLDLIRKQAEDEGIELGRKQGWEEGMKEAKRLLEHLHIIVDKTIDKRKSIIEGAEAQIVNLILMISRKVVKVISENQRSVVLQNIKQALEKLKQRGEITIRVNLADMDITTEHMNDFKQISDKIESVKIMEDSSVGPGGCIIETDFGQIDARIASQLKQIEDKIREAMPIVDDSERGI